jgi:hypothetical protein
MTRSTRKNVNSRKYLLPPDQYIDPLPHKGGTDDMMSLSGFSSDVAPVPVKETVSRFVSSKGEQIIDFQQFHHYLVLFKKYGLQPIQDLPAQQQVNFKEFNEFMQKVRENPEIYAQARSMIKEVFPYENTIIIPGTMNAYFIGCQCSSFDDDIRGCDPKCVNNLPAIVNGKVIPNACNDYVLVYYQGELQSLHEGTGKSTIAWIYVPRDFTTFDESSLRQLHDYGITTLNLLRADDEGKYSTIDENVPLNTLLPATVSDRNLTVNPSNPSSPANNTILGWVLLVICILIIIGIVIWLFWNARSQRMMQQASMGYSYQY